MARKSTKKSGWKWGGLKDPFASRYTYTNPNRVRPGQKSPRKPTYKIPKTPSSGRGVGP